MPSNFQLLVRRVDSLADRFNQLLDRLDGMSGPNGVNQVFGSLKEVGHGSEGFGTGEGEAGEAKGERPEEEGGSEEACEAKGEFGVLNLDEVFEFAAREVARRCYGIRRVESIAEVLREHFGPLLQESSQEGSFRQKLTKLLGKTWTGAEISGDEMILDVVKQTCELSHSGTKYLWLRSALQQAIFNSPYEEQVERDEDLVTVIKTALESVASYVRFRQDLRQTLCSVWPSNPGVSDGEIRDAVNGLVSGRALLGSEKKEDILSAFQPLYDRCDQLQRKYDELIGICFKSLKEALGSSADGVERFEDLLGVVKSLVVDLGRARKATKIAAEAIGESASPGKYFSIDREQLLAFLSYASIHMNSSSASESAFDRMNVLVQALNDHEVKRVDLE